MAAFLPFTDISTAFWSTDCGGEGEGKKRQKWREMTRNDEEEDRAERCAETVDAAAAVTEVERQWRQATRERIRMSNRASSIASSSSPTIAQ
jgi:ABC-type protease/lipase transport system fused ATPase/permease subunit